MRSKEIIPHLFRTEYSKIVAVLCKKFGLQHLDVAEDAASDTFLAALQHWPYQGIPANPAAWLQAVAKNKAYNHFQRAGIFKHKVLRQWTELQSSEVIEMIDLSSENILDSQLQMLFAVCHPALQVEAQISLALRILCGLGIEEVATAFLTNKETVNKRLYRAKQKLREENILLDFPGPSEIQARLRVVLTTIYLLFNEGYYSETDEAVIRPDLCAEALRLADLLVQNKKTQTPELYALLSLMCFHSSRFSARKDREGELVLYSEQDTALWDQDLISKGIEFLHKASGGESVSKYHLEATIAYWHTVPGDRVEKWEKVLDLYNRLLILEYSPVAALNRTYALAKVKGNTAALYEAEKLQLTNSPYYFSLLAHLYQESDSAKAKFNLQKAIALARTDADKRALEKRLAQL
jgi:RNA polymerase sigma factor (sigma-70 family)